ncbi:MAG: hypothetical protein APF84_18605 [Gracilibacter sp. BRH_c7a]|nr:MAG: hypothetical protein APF84_18605 [Gracilibacter sp. BRH_c7a]
MIVNTTIKTVLLEGIKNLLRVISKRITSIKEYLAIKVQPLRHNHALKRLRIKSKEDKVKVAFFVTHSSVWKYDGVYRLMAQDSRFYPIVVICPVVNYGRANMLEEMRKSYQLFKSKGYNVIKTYTENDDSYLDVKHELKPDIIFYTNPYQGLIKDEYYITNFNDTLTCYVHYAFFVSNLCKEQYDGLFHNVLWKAFYETDMHKQMAKEYARNKAKNVIITGYPGVDGFVYGIRTGEYLWKDSNKSLKRIIWAPHHTIEQEGWLRYSNFLRHYKIMLDLAEEYKDKIQIVFKPHPLLKVKLFRHKDWGIDKTNNYYKQWEDQSNTQLETDQYIDLFNTSDAMIFDSGSFVAEYLCCGKPSIFVFADINVKERFNEFGKLALDQHYHAYNEIDILRFVDTVVCEGQDEKKEKRNRFYKRFLESPNQNTASDNIFELICKEIFK